MPDDVKENMGTFSGSQETKEASSKIASDQTYDDAATLEKSEHQNQQQIQDLPVPVSEK